METDKTFRLVAHKHVTGKSRLMEVDPPFHGHKTIVEMSWYGLGNFNRAFHPSHDGTWEGVDADNYLGDKDERGKTIEQIGYIEQG